MNSRRYETKEEAQKRCAEKRGEYLDFINDNVNKLNDMEISLIRALIEKFIVNN